MYRRRCLLLQLFFINSQGHDDLSISLNGLACLSFHCALTTLEFTRSTFQPPPKLVLLCIRYKYRILFRCCYCTTLGCLTKTMDFETCYVYKPSSRQDTRPNKRRRVEPSGLHSSWPLRRSVYQRLWSEQEQRLKVSPTCYMKHMHRLTMEPGPTI